MIDFDLDVNADGLLTGIYDRAANYLPGYEGPTAMVSRGNSFNVPTYTSQRMMLVIDGLGTDTPGLEWVEFKIVQVSYHPGYAQNRTDPSIEGIRSAHWPSARSHWLIPWPSRRRILISTRSRMRSDMF